MMGIQDMPVVKEDRIHPVDRMGVKVISMGFFVENNAPIVWRGPMLGESIRSILP
ncbi:Iron-sulfur cluster carrier protein OS=Ureibacillus acetophenoni OX=614649 GN=SAMN05877842_1055 PE=3 SV=1 [Ureibacillus acetophenoni]